MNVMIPMPVIMTETLAFLISPLVHFPNKTGHTQELQKEFQQQLW